jgi:hypothetical protein
VVSGRDVLVPLVAVILASLAKASRPHANVECPVLGVSDDQHGRPAVRRIPAWRIDLDLILQWFCQQLP